MKEMHEARYGERAQSFYVLFPNLHVLTYLEVLQTLCFWVFKEASVLCMID